MKPKRRETMPDRPRPGLTTSARPAAVGQGRSKKYTTVSTYSKSVINLIQRSTLRCAIRERDIESVISKPIPSLGSRGIMIGTWNAQTLYACGKVKKQTHALRNYEWNVVSLSEVWTCCDEILTDEGHKLWFSGREITTNIELEY